MWCLYLPRAQRIADAHSMMQGSTLCDAGAGLAGAILVVPLL